MPALSVQLYSVRDAMAEDLPGTLARLAATGLEHVEPYDLSDPAGLRDALDAAGLSAPSAHTRLEGGELGPVLDAAAAVGVGTLVHAYSTPETWATPDGIRAVAEQLAAAAEAAAAHGIRIGYHNHHWEPALQGDGRTGLEHFADHAGPAVVIELDTYWAAVGGQDVPALLGRLGDRVRLLHLKDGPIDTDDASQLPLGDGAMPVPAILAAAPAAELGVLEFDAYAGDLFEGIATGLTYARGPRVSGPVGVGVVGAGKISEQYLPNMLSFPDLAVRCVADLDVDAARRQGEQHGIEACASVERAARARRRRARGQPHDPRRARRGRVRRAHRRQARVEREAARGRPRGGRGAGRAGGRGRPAARLRARHVPRPRPAGRAPGDRGRRHRDAAHRLGRHAVRRPAPLAPQPGLPLPARRAGRCSTWARTT